MKQLFFAGSFVISTILAYNWIGHDQPGFGSGNRFSSCASADTTPKKKKDSTRHKTGKDSLNRKDTIQPGKDTASH